MKKLGIIGYGWLGSRIADYLSSQFEIYNTTTSPEKLADLKSISTQVELVEFPEENKALQITAWDVISSLDAVIITIPFSSRQSCASSLFNKIQNISAFLGDYTGQLFMMNSTGVYDKEEKVYTEADQAIEKVSSERLFKTNFPQINILRLAGLMGDDRLLKNYNVSNLDAPVNHVHYQDIARVVQLMIELEQHAKLYNVVAPIHPSKQDVINAQNNELYDSEKEAKGRIISSAKLIEELDFTFNYPDPRYFHI
ncbi:hypothetical protein NMK71_06555 [Weeksellaceae bacterium KMM 9713]|uniref:Uncharacterized protein n=1 Tax=Profundicola chukchiensis TaxID=2961959 RepID=A0A9X4MY03_9FLAO|nr:hypothetical protein [Profundicola chukchiensis]MDG4946069.1 hypothetical protein [Profundicola chukchiensis]